MESLIQFTHKRFLNFSPGSEIIICTVEEVSTATRSVFQNLEMPQLFPKSWWRSPLFHLSKNYTSLWVIFSCLPLSLIIDSSEIQIKIRAMAMNTESKRLFLWQKKPARCAHTIPAGMKGLTPTAQEGAVLKISVACVVEESKELGNLGI